MARSHGSSSFVMPLGGSGNVARSFCCRAGAWRPTPAFDGWVATSYAHLVLPLSAIEPAASKEGGKWPEAMAPLLL